MQFKGEAKRLIDTDLPRIGSRIGVGEDPIHAFLEVETSGSGFDAQGRPKLLFEPHVFYRLLTDPKKRARAVAAGLAYPKWGEQKYPRESYTRMLAAMEIDAEIALRSGSWGLGQLMGFNCVAAGYPTAADMVADFMDSEANQLNAAVTFIINSNLDDELRDRNWAAFARGYNGAGYAKNQYDTKLKAAYEKWSRIPDTKWDPKKTMREAMDAPAVLPVGPVNRVFPPEPKPVSPVVKTTAEISERAPANPPSGGSSGSKPVAPPIKVTVEVPATPPAPPPSTWWARLGQLFGK